jgi:hypothetical protein
VTLDRPTIARWAARSRSVKSGAVPSPAPSSGQAFELDQFRLCPGQCVEGIDRTTGLAQQPDFMLRCAANSLIKPQRLKRDQHNTTLISLKQSNNTTFSRLYLTDPRLN